MKNTDNNFELLQSVISSEASLEVLLGIISDMDLEIEDVRIG